MLINFLRPYISILYGAASNIEQSLEGLGVVSSNFVKWNEQGIITESYWSPAQVAQSIFGLFILCVPILFLLWGTAGYVVGRKKGLAVTIFLALLPGMLSLMGAWPVLSFMPDTFVIRGKGVLGSGWGMLPLVVLGMLTGWSMLVVLCDLFNLNDRFWHLYDHFWVAAAILTGIFFVADSQVAEHNRELQESSRTFQQASAYLLKQVGGYSTWCSHSDQPQSASCRWASDVHQLLIDYSTEHVAIASEFGPKSTIDVYSPFQQHPGSGHVETIRTELAAYNHKLCPVTELGKGTRRFTRSSPLCQTPPPMFCNAYPEPLNGVVDNDAMIKTSAIANECLIPTLIMLRAQQETLLKKVEADRIARHYRWMFYVAFSIIAGGKIASSTLRVVSFNQRISDDRRRSLRFVRRICIRSWATLQFIFGTVIRACRLVFYMLSKAFPR